MKAAVEASIQLPPKTGSAEIFLPDGGAWVRPWLSVQLGVAPSFDPWHRTWLVPRRLFRDAVAALAGRYMQVRVVTYARTSSTRQCDTRCVEARGDECTCQCGGANHQGSLSDYEQIGETTLIARDESWNKVVRVIRERS